MEPVATHAATLENLVPRARHNQHLPELRIPLDVTSLLQKVRPDSSRGLTEKFRYVQDAEAGPRPEPCGQLRASNIEPRPCRNTASLEIENAGCGISQNNSRSVVTLTLAGTRQ